MKQETFYLDRYLRQLEFAMCREFNNAGAEFATTSAELNNAGAEFATTGAELNNAGAEFVALGMEFDNSTTIFINNKKPPMKMNP